MKNTKGLCDMCIEIMGFKLKPDAIWKFGLYCIGCKEEKGKTIEIKYLIRK